ncbi:MAG: polynucleotide kinase-phosphatase [Candidatus Melainabacteria bacterium]|jgi:protein phosphatase|nr:polynucleotide kinase-phosphatase [Candidatus Melainabacteria bacterium]
MKISIPELCLVALIGPSGCGKSTFGKRHFKPTEVISSDFCRGLVSDDENDQSVSKDAFDLVRYITSKRLMSGKLSVIDATSVRPEDRKEIVATAKAHDVFAVAIVFNIPSEVCQARNDERPDRQFGGHVVRRQHIAMRQSLRGLEREGFRHVYVLDSPEKVDAVEIERTKLWTNKRDEKGPFDIIGDVHGCYDELETLLKQLGYTSGDDGVLAHPDGRKAIFVGDLVDRGPKTPEVLRLVMSMVNGGTGLCVVGNHEAKLIKKLKGKDVRITHGLKESLEQLDNQSDEFKQQALKFMDKLVSHYVLDEGNLVVAHAGLKEQFQGRSSGRVREFAMYGETTGETDEYGLPVRYNWAQDYRGDAMVVYGHTPVPESEWINKTICLDTGCVFGGKLTALRYPEKELVSVKAAYTYYESVKPFLPEGEVSAAMNSGSARDSDMLDIQDVLGKRIISTRLQRSITVREENAIAAIEVMSRFAVNPKWLVYLPPTMSPSETTSTEGMLEHPAEALRYFMNAGIPTVICEEKHMGSRAVVIVCRDEQVAQKRFKVYGEGRGICYTRTGRRFFNDLQMEREFISKVHAAIDACGWWNEFQSDWFIFDCELMPWSAKAQELLRKQYAAVGAAARVSLNAAVYALQQTAARLNGAEELLDRYAQREKCTEQFRDAYRQYCWTVNSLDDLKLAPFHLLATEKKTYFDKNHQWHMDTLAKLAGVTEGMLIATPYKVVDVTSSDDLEQAISWWQELTDNGGEGMVVKPLDFIATGSKGFVQPAIKCRGKEYLRIIYGPEYTAPEHLERLRVRGVGGKRALAAREFALGVEALERFVREEPLYRVHECVFGVLAMETEPVDPRL